MAGIVVDVTHQFFVPYHNLRLLIVDCLKHLKFAPKYAHSHPVNRLARKKGKMAKALVGAMQGLLQFFVNAKMRELGPGEKTDMFLAQAFAQPVHHLVAEALIMFCRRLEMRAVPDATLTPSPFRTMHLLCLLFGHAELDYLEEVIDSRLAHGCDVYRCESQFGLYPYDLLVKPENFGYGDVDEIEPPEEPEPSCVLSEIIDVDDDGEYNPPSPHSHQDYDAKDTNNNNNDSNIANHPREALKGTLKILELETEKGGPLPPNKPRSMETLQISYYLRRMCLLISLSLLALVVIMCIIVFGFGGFQTSAAQTIQAMRVLPGGMMDKGPDTVILVNTLANAGPGSLQAAVDAAGPRTVVFAVSGIIDGDIDIFSGDLTIAGETAPGMGITIQGTVRINAVDNVVIRFLRVRSGESLGTLQLNAIYVGLSSNIILDHLSLSWALGPLIDLVSVSNITISYSTLEEPVDVDSILLSKAVAATRVNQLSFHHNLVAHSGQYNPFLAQSSADIRYNLFYNFNGGVIASASKVNVINNCYTLTKEMQESLSNVTLWDMSADCRAAVLNNHVSALGNVDDPWTWNSSRPNHKNSTRFGFSALLAEKSPPFDFFVVPPATALEKVPKVVLTEAGCFPNDLVTQRIKREVVLGSGWGSRKDPPQTGESGVIRAPEPQEPKTNLNISKILNSTILARMAADKLRDHFDPFNVTSCQFNLTVIGATVFETVVEAIDAYRKQTLTNTSLPPNEQATPIVCFHEVFLVPPLVPPNTTTGWTGYTETLNPHPFLKEIVSFLMPAADVYIEFLPQADLDQEHSGVNPTRPFFSPSSPSAVWHLHSP